MSKEKREPGRPGEMKDNPRKRGTNYSFYLSEDQIEKLEEIHWREKKSVSEIAREAIDDWLRNHAEGNSTFRLDIWQEDPEFKAIPTLLSSQEKWNKYIEECCNDSELTNISVMANHIHQIVKMRRNKEYSEKQKEKSGILNYYKNKK